MRLDLESAVTSPVTSIEVSTAGPAVEQILRDGIAAAQNGDRRTARLLLDQVTTVQPENADAWLWLASISEYPEELMVFLGKVLAVDPANERALSWRSATSTLLAKTHLERGIIASEEGNTDLANQCFDAALENNANCVEAWKGKAKLADDEETMVSLYRKVLELDADDVEANAAVSAVEAAHFGTRLLEVKRTAAAGDHTSAEIALEELLGERPDSLELWMMQVHLASSFEGKFDAYNKMLEIDENNVYARTGFDFLGQIAADVAPQPAADMMSDPNAEAAAVEEVLEPVAEQPAMVRFDAQPEPEMTSTESDDVEFATMTTADNLEAVIEEPMAEFEEVEEPRSLAAEELVRENETYASPDAETREYSLADDDLAGYVPQVESDDRSIHETDVPESDMSASSPWESVVEQPTVEAAQVEEPKVEVHCNFCSSELESNQFECHACGSVLTLSDIERLLAAAPVRPEAIRESVRQMENDWKTREFSCEEAQQLAIGHFNLKNHELGFAYLQEASRFEPNNVILSSQINALQIRLDEIKRHNEDLASMPKGRSILVVDDSATVRKLISNKLEKSGHVVACAEDGVEAMEWIGANKPDLVLLDIAMPRMDGYQVCKLIRSNEATKDVPVVMISGKDGFFDKVRGRMAGTSGYITKPFGPETLMRALDTYLVNEPQPEAAPELVAA